MGKKYPLEHGDPRYTPRDHTIHDMLRELRQALDPVDQELQALEERLEGFLIPKRPAAGATLEETGGGPESAAGIMIYGSLMDVESLSVRIRHLADRVEV